MPRFAHSLVFRLTALYAALFSLAFLVIFAAIYYLIASAFMKATDEELREDRAEMEAAYRKGGIEALKAYIAQEMADGGPGEQWIGVFTPEGRVVAASDAGAWGDMPLNVPQAMPAFETLPIPARPHLKARAITFPLGPYIVEEAVPMAWDAELLGRLRNAFLAGALLTLVLSIASGWFAAKRALAHIRRIDEVASRIATGNDLSQRVPLRDTGDELDRLAATFNAMLKRLEAFVRELSEMMDNTAHDFKTPLTRIRAMAESSLQNADPQEVRETLVQIMEESDRFLALLHAIMDISEAKTGLLALKRETFPVKALLEETEAFFQGLAKARGIRFEVTYPRRDIPLFGDRRRILQALLNIADNAFKFTPPGGTIALWAEQTPRGVSLCVSDTGPGIPEEEIPRIFERFYRRDRARASPGRGIGLSLAKAFVEAHGGRIEVKSAPQAGSTFCIHLPENAHVA